eukprot:g46664.t1
MFCVLTHCFFYLFLYETFDRGAAEVSAASRRAPSLFSAKRGVSRFSTCPNPQRYLLVCRLIVLSRCPLGLE